MKMDKKNKSPVTTEASPVRAPSDTPEELSTNVVVVEVPSMAPQEVAMESASRALRILGSFPSLSNIFALSAQAIIVPNVSKISTKRKENIITIKSRMRKLAKAADEKH